jgi:UDP-glucuronate 4-epimerase
VKVLITGGAGFIGSHLAKRLLPHHLVTVVDCLHPYYAPDRKRAQLEATCQAGSFHFVELDLLDETACEELFQQGQFEIVYHLAAVPGVTYSIENPRLYMDYNVKATVNVLNAAGKSGVKHVLFASSSSVYGDREGAALSENMADGRVISPYAATKVAGEALCHTYQYLFGYRMTVLRFFTVYGPWGRPDMAFGKFIRRLRDGQPIEVFGEQSARDYTFVDDITAGLEKALKSPLAFGVYNLGAGSPVEMSSLLEQFQVYFPDMEVVRKPWRTGDVRMTWADTTQAELLLGYKPVVSIGEGLRKTMEWANAYPFFV